MNIFAMLFCIQDCHFLFQPCASQMAISHYESSDRRPDMDAIKALAAALGVRVADLFSNRNENLVFVHGEFRKGSRLPVKQ